MDDDPHITLAVPPPPTDAFDWDDHYIAVPTDLVEYAIDVLRCYLAQWRQPKGIEPEDQAYNALAVAAGHALAGLLASLAAHNTQGGAAQLIGQIANFFYWRDAREYLANLRGRQDTADIVEALLALHEERERRRNEWMPQRAPQGPQVQVWRPEGRQQCRTTWRASRDRKALRPRHMPPIA
jgi:hypothetical protein